DRRESVKLELAQVGNPVEWDCGLWVACPRLRGHEPGRRGRISPRLRWGIRWSGIAGSGWHAHVIVGTSRGECAGSHLGSGGESGGVGMPPGVAPNSPPEPLESTLVVTALACHSGSAGRRDACTPMGNVIPARLPTCDP